MFIESTYMIFVNYTNSWLNADSNKVINQMQQFYKFIT